MKEKYLDKVNFSELCEKVDDLYPELRDMRSFNTRSLVENIFQIILDEIGRGNTVVVSNFGKFNTTYIKNSATGTFKKGEKAKPTHHLKTTLRLTQTAKVANREKHFSEVKKRYLEES